jgi:hypothetical protein
VGIYGVVAGEKEMVNGDGYYQTLYIALVTATEQCRYSTKLVVNFLTDYIKDIPDGFIDY